MKKTRTIDPLKQILEYLDIMKNREVGWGALFFGLGLMYSVFILSDFYSPVESRGLFLCLGYLFFCGGTGFLAYSLERNELRTTHFYYTKGQLVVFVLILSVGFFDSLFARYISIIGIIISFIMLSHYGKVIISRARGLKKMAFPVYGLFIGLFILFLGFCTTTDTGFAFFGWIGRLIGDLLQLTGTIIIGLAFYFLPSFSEFDWIDRVRALFVVHPSGISLFNHVFPKLEQNPKESYEPDLTTGAIVAIKAMMQDLSTKRQSHVQSIKKENFMMLLEYGKHTICVLITEQDSISIREKLKAFCKAFEVKYEKNLASWYGKVDIFHNANELVKKFFKA